MAITKSLLAKDLDLWKAFLESLAIFKTVTKDGSTLTCTDDDDNTVLTIQITSSTAIPFTVYAKDGATVTSSPNINTGNMYGYKCGGGGLIYINTSSSTYISILITKNNQDKITIMLPHSQQNTPQPKNVYVVTYNDVAPFTAYQLGNVGAQRTQTVLVPLLTNAQEGTVSYTPKAFWCPFSEYYERGALQFVMGGKQYLSTGFFVLEDGPAET